MTAPWPWRKPSFRLPALAGVVWLSVTPMATARDANCETSLSATQVDYGRLSRATLAAGANGTVVLPSRSLALHVRCDETQDMSLSLRGVAAGVDVFRFTEHGRFVVRLRDMRLDGERADIGETDGQGAPLDRITSASPWRPGKKLVPVRNGRSQAGRELTAWMDIEAVVDERALAVGDASPWTENVSVEAVTSGAARDLAMRAEIIPGRCDIEVTRHLSFGRLRSTDLDPRGASTRVPSTHGARMQVLCDAPMPFALRVTRDERAGTAHVPVGVGTSYADTQLFGLGTTPSGQRIGSYVLHWHATATSDRGELQATRSTDGGASWSPVGGPVLAARTGGERMGYAPVQGTAMGPLAVTALQVGLDATIYIAPRHLLPLNEDIRADGLVTFEIIY